MPKDNVTERVIAHTSSLSAYNIPAIRSAATQDIARSTDSPILIASADGLLTMPHALLIAVPIFHVILCSCGSLGLAYAVSPVPETPAPAASEAPCRRCPIAPPYAWKWIGWLNIYPSTAGSSSQGTDGLVLLPILRLGGSARRVPGGQRRHYARRTTLGGTCTRFPDAPVPALPWLAVCYAPPPMRCMVYNAIQHRLAGP